MALASVPSLSTPSAASNATTALVAAALASRMAVSTASGRLSRAGLPPRLVVAASKAAQSGMHFLPSSRPPPTSVAALSALDTDCAAPARAPGL
ncbi:hypothetical protein ZWY2020_022772 [Hordeum vulgare]|nr:hypothetical protein ZWY2020_022772 [Hordeum vulgare]